MNNIFSEKAWEDYTDWQIQDKAMTKKINELIKDINRNGLSIGIGKPEPLKHRKAWSRRITKEHRLVYNLNENQDLVILSCKGHYED
ncbi:MAG: Txe/YoeB family addiction module toxin [Clostridia bacterium]|nr:Txe/YoeB family addiction module toxin [Clostridia bacterium]